MCVREKKYSLIRDIIEPHWHEYQRKYPRMHSRIVNAVDNMRICRTKELGVNEYVCPDCGEVKIVYHSCKHRFCPQCGQADTNKWAQKILTKLIDIKHYHVIVTIPHELNDLFRYNEKLLYGLFMKVLSEVLITWFREKHQLIPGIMEVYHSFGSDLRYHNHLHVLVSAGGLTPDYKEVKEISMDYLINADYLMRKFRWSFEKALYCHLEKGNLILPPDQDKRYFKKFIKDVNKKGNWVSFVCPNALSNPLDIISYIGRYSKRACISEYRIDVVTPESITFTYKDYKAIKKGDKEIIKQVTLPWCQFLNRLFQHIPHKGFRMVRYYGIYNNSVIGRIPEEFHYNPEHHTNDITQEEADKKIKMNRSCTSYKEYLLLSTKIKGYFCETCGKEYQLISRKYNKNKIKDNNNFEQVKYANTG